MTDDNTTEPDNDDSDQERPWRGKAVGPDYKPEPFYYRDETFPEARRFALWSADFRQVGDAMLALLETFPERVDVLLKSSKADGEVYLRWAGNTGKADILAAIVEHSEYVFQCGYDVLCLKNPDTQEYIALDEFGIIWYYSNSDDCTVIFDNLGFINRVTPLVTEGGCWVISVENADELRNDFIAELGLKAVE